LAIFSVLGKLFSAQKLFVASIKKTCYEGVVMDIHISLAAEKIGEISGFPITNTLLMSWVVMIILLTLGYFVGRRTSLVPDKVQLIFESLFDYVLSYMTETFGSRSLAEKFFPFIATLFIFIFASNMLEFIPGVGSIGFFHNDGVYSEFVPLLRSVNTDFNVTLALAIISFLVIEISGIVVLGFWKYGKKFINFSSGMNFFLGIMEFISELARLISFSFRLFGNIFAGEVLIAVALAFLPYLLPVPLMLYELFVGFIQAAIFALLTLFFVKLSIAEPERH
jgi:F-type H+-transporting ATPase subunit a